MKLVDKAICIEEISRVKKNDETVITFRLQMDVPLGQSATSRHLVLIPLDKKIKQLIVPVVAYRSLSQSKRLELLQNGRTETREIEKKGLELHPKLINLGLVPYGEEQRFNVTGHPELLGSLKIIGHEQLPQGTSITLHYGDDLSEDVLNISICIGESLRSGLFRGTIRLQSSHRDEHSIGVIGLMGPKN